jgi:ubiquinone/menaquinone biosynthesis C-methylase UbiE
MLDEARRRSTGLPITYCAGVGEDLPLADATVDGVVIFTTLEWTDDPSAAWTRLAGSPGPVAGF